MTSADIPPQDYFPIYRPLQWAIKKIYCFDYVKRFPYQSILEAIHRGVTSSFLGPQQDLPSIVEPLPGEQDISGRPLFPAHDVLDILY